MSSTFVSRRTMRRPGPSQHEVSGILAAGITTALRKSREGVLTWWRIDDDGEERLARAALVSSRHCVIEVLTGAGLRSVRRRTVHPDQLIALEAPAHPYVLAGAVWRSEFIHLEDAGYAIYDWLTDGALGEVWQLV